MEVKMPSLHLYFLIVFYGHRRNINRDWRTDPPCCLCVARRWGKVLAIREQYYLVLGPTRPAEAGKYSHVPDQLDYQCGIIQRESEWSYKNIWYCICKCDFFERGGDKFAITLPVQVTISSAEPLTQPYSSLKRAFPGRKALARFQDRGGGGRPLWDYIFY